MPGPVPMQQAAAIKFTVQGSLFTSNFVPPSLTIDGFPAPTSGAGGTRLIPCPPGPHRLEASSKWLRRYGQASLDIVVAPNSELEVFYAPPFHQFTSGAMGLSPQPRKGLAALLIIMGVLVAFVILVIAINVAS